MATRIFKNKWLVIIVFCLAIVVYDALALNVSIVNRGLVIGMAIDYEGEELTVTAQVTLPKNGGVGAGGNNYLNVTATDRTFQGCLSKLSEQLGSSISLAHTVVMIFGKALLEGGRVDLIEKLIIKDAFHDSMLLCMADGKAQDILSAKVPYADTASFQLQRLIVPIKPALGQTGLSLKQFIVDYYDKNTACYLPIVHIEKGAPSSDQGKDGVDSADILRVERSAIVGKRGFICELDGADNDGFSLLKRNLAGGTIGIVGRNGERVGVKVIESVVVPHYDLNNLTVSYTARIKVIRETGSDDELNMVSFKLTQEERAATVEQVKNMISGCFNKLIENSADALLLYENYYQRYGKAWEQRASVQYLQQLKLDIVVDIKER